MAELGVMIEAQEGLDWALWRQIASDADRLGFASLWAPEHVVLLDRYASKYPYSAGEFPVPTHTPGIEK